jgi:hypothetical protein
MVRPFEYPSHPHQRRHGPRGYTDYTSYKPWLRDEFAFPCVYCLIRERWRNPHGSAAFAVEHCLPKERYPELETEYDNLLYSCNACNFFKGDLFVPPDPCRVAYGELLQVAEDGRVVPIAPGNTDAEIIIAVFRLNDTDSVAARTAWIALHRRLALERSAEERTLFRHFFGYPDDLPNLGSLRPPANFRPEGLSQSFFELRRRNELPTTY